MKKALRLSMELDKPIVIMYLSKNTVTRRKIKVLSMDGEKVFAYCFLREKNRSFIIDNILSAQFDE